MLPSLMPPTRHASAGEGTEDHGEHPPTPGPFPPARSPGRHAGEPRSTPAGVTLVREGLAASALALGLPSVIMRRQPSIRYDTTEHGRRWPVLLLHGFAGSDAVWDPLARALRVSGFGYVARVSYNSFITDADEVVRAVREQAAASLAATEAGGLHLIGHSLGGLLLRSAVDHGMLVDLVTVVTIATPHAGLRLARWLPGSCARLMHPGSSIVRSVPSEHGAVRWVTFSSDGDRVVPPSSARLEELHPAVTNVHVPGRGHLTICRDPGLVARVVLELVRSERRLLEPAA
jgi:pimeloyl-ACP methyl ester carboxylesterase